MSVSAGTDNVVKKYGDITIISNLSALIKDGELSTLLGPLGYDKTTLLRMIAGSNGIEGGTIQSDDKVTSDILAQKRNIGMVFQSYAIFPHLMVRQSVEYGLKIRRVSKNQMKKRVDETLRVVKIGGYRDRLPERLPDGQQRGVAPARAIVIHPQVLLMDEPLSNLDTKLCIEMRSTIHDMQGRVNITTVYATHDQEEALAISDRTVAVELGVTQQIGSPQDIYVRPYSASVSTFTGYSDLFFGTVKKQGSIPSVVFTNGYHVEMPNLMDTVTEGQKVIIPVRPEEFSLNPEDMEYEIISRTFLGKCANYFLRFGEGMMLEDQPNTEYSQGLGHVDRILEVGEKIHLGLDPNRINVFAQDVEQSLIKDVKGYDE